MFKKTVVLSVVVALMLLGLFVDPSAAQNVTSVSKRGSLLVWPKIDTSNLRGPVGDVVTADTIVMIGNDGASDVMLKCYWMDSSQQPQDFEFPVTAYQPVWFSAKSGYGSVWIPQFGDNKTGELKCWAIDPNPAPGAPGTLEQLRIFNYLYGNALILHSAPYVRAFEYNAWAFYLNGAPSNPSGPLNLSGVEYDYCPGYLIYNFFALAGVADGAVFGPTTLTLAPCQQDLRQDHLPVCGKAKFDIWNENEFKLTGAYQCVKCWFEGVLTDIGIDVWTGCNLAAPSKCKATGVGGNKFSLGVLKTDMGRFRVSPDSFVACKNVFAKYDVDGKTPVDVCASAANQYKTPFLGVRVTEVGILALYDGLAGSTGTTAGVFNQVTQAGGFLPRVLWDAAENFQTPQK